MKDVEVKNLLKKVYYLLIALVVLSAVNTFVLIINSNNSVGTTTNTKKEEETIEYDVTGLKEVKAKELADATKEGKHVVYIGRSTCGWCAKFLPFIKKAQEEFKYTTLYVDIAKIIDFSVGSISDKDAYDAMTNFKASTDYEDYMKKNFGTTPMILIIENGKIIAGQTGYVEYDTYKAFLNKNGIK